MAVFDVRHADPRSLARAAAVRSVREQDPRTLAQARAMPMAERLQAGFLLSRAASSLRITGR